MSHNNWNASLYDQKYAFVFEKGKGLIPLLDPQLGESILDLGCGTGHLTKTIAESGARVIGIDSSAQMIETARATYPELEFLIADARDFSFNDPFDAIFSNATLHWVRPPESVVRRISASLKAGGRFVAEFGGKGNVSTIITAVQQSMGELTHTRVDFGWYFLSMGEYASLLEQHSLAVKSAMLFERPTPLEDGEMGLRNWIHMFGDRIFQNVPDAVRQQVLERTEEKARPHLFRDDQWFADYVRLRISHIKSDRIPLTIHPTSVIIRPEILSAILFVYSEVHRRRGKRGNEHASSHQNICHHHLHRHILRNLIGGARNNNELGARMWQYLAILPRSNHSWRDYSLRDD